MAICWSLGFSEGIVGLGLVVVLGVGVASLILGMVLGGGLTIDVSRSGSSRDIWVGNGGWKCTVLRSFGPAPGFFRLLFFHFCSIVWQWRFVCREKTFNVTDMYINFFLFALISHLVYNR